MNKPYGLPPAMSAASAAMCTATARRRLGFLSGFINAILIVSGGLLGLAVAFQATLRERYPIELTLRPATKRPMLLIGADGQPFAKRGECIAEPVTLDELPRHFIDAVLATEDRRFYSHMGVDPWGVLRAVRRNSRAGAIREGASTVTQQLVKISFLTSAATFERKLEEALLAMWLEQRLTKDQILERYLSSVYFGDGCFGVRAAARRFFGKPVRELTVSESALMVVLLRSPSRFIKNLGDARRVAGLVVRSMVREGRLDEARLADIQPAKLVVPPPVNQFGAYYADWLADALQREMKEPHSQRPIEVHTTFEPELQRIAEKAVGSVLDEEGRERHVGQAALVAMRADGRVVAMVGGREWAVSRFNRAVQARRQPGSTFKMFVYLAALQAGARPDMVFEDEPISIDGWEPKNFGGGHRGKVTLTQAFTSSINTVAVKVSEAVGRDAVIDTARKLGIASPITPNASLSLGASEASLLEMTAAYAAIAAGAYPVKPWGAAGLGAKPADGGKPPPEAGLWKLAEADSMRELLSSVVDDGSGRAAQLPIPAFGKTGTSQGFRDAWFIGFAGDLVVGVWVGNDDNTPMKGVTGGSLPAQIWQIFMQDALDADADFHRRPAPIEVFEARSRAPLHRASSLASLKGLVAAADQRSRTTRRFRNAIARGSETLLSRRAEQGAPVSEDFQHRLSDAGWPDR